MQQAQQGVPAQSLLVASLAIGEALLQLQLPLCRARWRMTWV